MGVVYLARQEPLGRLVALKTLPPEVARDETARRRFEREVAALSRVEHPNVVRVLASGRDEARHTPYYAMEYVEGADLAEVARAPSPMPGMDVLEAMVGASLAAVLHALGREEDALARAREALAVADAAAARATIARGDLERATFLACGVAAETSRNLGRREDAVLHYARLAEIERAALAAAPDDRERMTGAADMLEALGDARAAVGDRSGAKAAWRESVALSERALAAGGGDDERRESVRALRRKIAGEKE
jgi:predicted Ser/Thr protein kinase